MGFWGHVICMQGLSMSIWNMGIRTLHVAAESASTHWLAAGRRDLSLS